MKIGIIGVRKIIKRLGKEESLCAIGEVFRGTPSGIAQKYANYKGYNLKTFFNVTFLFKANESMENCSCCKIAQFLNTR